MSFIHMIVKISLGICFIMLFCSVVPAEQPPEFITKWGSDGSGDGQFYYPQGIVVDFNGNVYVADTGNYRIQKFTSDGVFIIKWGRDDQFSEPIRMAVDSNGEVYICDTGNHLVQKFTPEGEFINDIHFDWPHGISVDLSGDILILDDSDVYKFSPDGIFISSWEGQFDRPRDMGVGSSGNIYVANHRGCTIQKYNTDGVLLIEWGNEGSNDERFDSLVAIAVDPSGNVYALDADNSQIQKFTLDGEFIFKWGSEGTNDGQFYEPQGIAVDASGNIYVVDTGNARIQKFGNTPAGTNVLVSDWGSGVTLTFSEVTSGGCTQITTTETGPPPPTGFKLNPLGTYYEITTSASYTGMITICINYDDSGLNSQQENNLTLRQYEPDTAEWIDITTTLDTVNNIICSEAEHLSLFGVMYQDTLPASVDINPGTLNLKSGGKWVTAYIELEGVYNVQEIDISTVSIAEIDGVEIENPIYAESSPTEIDDYNNNGILDLMVKFNRQKMIEVLSPGNHEIKVSGILIDGTRFNGTNTIEVIRPGKNSF